jgi:hypothetical protein
MSEKFYSELLREQELAKQAKLEKLKKEKEEALRILEEQKKTFSAPKNIKEQIKDFSEISNNSNVKLIEKTLGLLGGNTTINTTDPLTPLEQNFITQKDLEKHYKEFIARVQHQLSTLGGGGEVNFRRLDDVNNFTMTNNNDNWVLEYDSNSGKVQFTNRIGPIDTLRFDLTHEHDEIRTPGTLCWSQEDKTLNLEHPDGVTQQVGQETYIKVRNRTGNTIPNGSVVRFAGAEQNGAARLLVDLFIANGSFPSLYGLGITTQDIENNSDGLVTTLGKIRNIDTSNWDIGDILYVSPTVAGGLTNIKPTAPNNVIPIAAVLRDDTEEGEIFVRPTIEQQYYYGRFAKISNQTANNVNTEYLVLFDDTEISNGVTIGDPVSRIEVTDSGFYQFDSSYQITATSNKGVVYTWFKKNGTAIPYSSRSTTITNGDTFTLNNSLQISLNANDYVELAWATTASGILLQANSSPAIGTAVASVLLSVAQLQL